ncbi:MULTISPECIES: hypothetical protein [16SrII (Peanut WB group)]|nr:MULTISPECIES: hypothetical protein [16SrII (Peanut WB group)]MDO8055031.1 hypothetical protein ['Cleome sp.' phytoplasma]MDV3155084.1 hypothetical protein [Sweet potato little leaf phytoplasma]
MNLNIECNPEHKTLGFLLKLEHDQKLNEFYLTFNEIFQNENNIEQFKFIDKLLILRTNYDTKNCYNSFFHHLDISVLYKKTFEIQKKAFFNARLT